MTTQPQDQTPKAPTTKPRATGKRAKKSKRTAPANVAARDQTIFKAWKAGTPVSKLAARYQRTPQRIGEILLAQAGSRQALKRLRANQKRAER